MSKNLFIGVDGKARKTKDFYIGINGKAHKIVKAYIGDENGKARLFWEKETNIAENSLEFVSDNSFTMNTTKLWDGTIEYNNGNGWAAWNGSQISSSNIDGRQRIYFRGSNNTYIMGSNGSRDNAWKITGSNVECNGNLWNILDYNTVKQDNIPTHAKYCFYHMFDSCEALVKVPALGKKYSGNTKIFRAPKYCYAYMFYGCSNILEPAELVSRTVDSYCYLATYQNCIKLTKGVDFSSCFLADNAEYCYSNMFYGCSNLEEVKSFGITTGVGIFYKTYGYCYSIKTIPDIIVRSGGKNNHNKSYSTYKNTFIHCLGLKRYPVIDTGKTETVYDYENHFDSMFLGCILPIYDSTASNLVPYKIPKNGSAYAGTIQSFYGNEDSPKNINLNTTYYIENIDYTITSIPTQYLTFSSVNPFSISNYNLVKKVFYSTDKTNWEFWAGEYETAKINPTNGKYEIYFAGEGNTSLYDSSTTGYATFKIYSDTKDVECNGNINTLLDHIKVENNQEIVYTQKTFAYLFHNCKELISAPTLPATTLALESYNSMFMGCSSLTTAPELPATNLDTACYSNMFYECSSLTTAPELPATTLPENPFSSVMTGCYYAMFFRCNSLTTAPALPATIMTKGCYANMFAQCNSLTTAPALPATTLAFGCYSNMFSGCKNLTTAPALPATTLAEHCYNNMFYGCFRLRKIPALPAHILPDYCYYGMFKECDIHLYSSGDETKNIIYLLPSEKNQWTSTQKESNSLTDMFTYDGLIQTPSFPAGYRLDNYYSIIS